MATGLAAKPPATLYRRCMASRPIGCRYQSPQQNQNEAAHESTSADLPARPFWLRKPVLPGQPSVSLPWLLVAGAALKNNVADMMPRDATQRQIGAFLIWTACCFIGAVLLVGWYICHLLSNGS